ncbi:hypothetical protein TNCV_3860101 [Trichonephila clavipes]|nr:hypothetical protein TNCV_3860101 [Trichonephila clavipes]
MVVLTELGYEKREKTYSLILDNWTVHNNAPPLSNVKFQFFRPNSTSKLQPLDVAAVAEWCSNLIVALFVTSSSPVPLKTRRVGQRCTLNLSRAETSFCW